MVDALVGIYNFFVEIFEIIGFLFHFLHDIIYVLIDAISCVPTLLGWIPKDILGVIVGGIGVVVVYKIMGREG